MMFAMSLIAALSGTPLRQAEAANDFVRCLTDVAEGQDIDDVDGGVGDDSGATILRAGSDDISLQTMITVASLDGFLQPFSRTDSSKPFAHQPLADPVATLTAGAVGKHARLECFLF
jgi:hypothetical protein